MLYLPFFDVVLTSYAPIMERELVRVGQAVANPPVRPGGYHVADDDDRLYRLLFRRACDLYARQDRRY